MTPFTNLRRDTSFGVFPSILRSELSAMFRNDAGELPRRALSIHRTYRQGLLQRAEMSTLRRLGIARDATPSVGDAAAECAQIEPIFAARSCAIFSRRRPDCC